jgi:hypothetical protein
MSAPFLIVIIVLSALLVVLFFSMWMTVKGLQATIFKLEKRVEGLQAEVSRQQQNLDDVRAVLRGKSEDPFQTVLQGFDRFRSRGLLPAVAWFGVRLFRSYLNNKARRTALPVLDKSTE